MTNRDELGRRRDCHFCVSGTRKVFCVILKDFYNAEAERDNLCGECPFFKTDADFFAGWSSRRGL